MSIDARKRRGHPAVAYENPFEAHGPPAPSSRLITEAQFSELYSAARFAAWWATPLDTMVTITWPMLGMVDEEAVAQGWEAFRKCLAVWLKARRLPMAWIYCHERGHRRGLHSHIALFIPGKELHPDLRRDFRSWVLKWARGAAGRPVPKSTRVRDDGGRRSMICHWRHLSYICKGYDKSVVVVPGEATKDRQPIHLGDLIAWEWEDPGYVAMKRVGVSQSLGAGTRRAVGYPEWAAWYCERPTINLDLSLPVSARTNAVVMRRPYRIRYGKGGRGSLASQVCTPWLSPYEYGVRHIGGLYPAEFIEVVEVGYPTAKELRARKRDSARAAAPLEVEEVTEPDFPGSLL